MSQETGYRAAVAAVATELRALHRALVDASRGMYELEHGPIQGPNALLQLLMGDPEFAWLRELSGVMADVDELLELADVDEADAAAVRAEIERLIAAPGDDASFGARYREALQAEMDVVVAHGRLRSALAALPEPDEASGESSAERRKSWPARRAEQRKR